MVSRVLLGVGMVSLLGVLSGCSAVEEETAGSDNALAQNQECSQSTSCVVAKTALKGQITEKLPTEIDSGWMTKGSMKVRTRFTINPPKDEPLLTVDMPEGAQLEASWSPAQRGQITLKPRTLKDSSGDVKVHYTLIPSLEANLWGVNIAKDSTQLLESLAGQDFNYEAQNQSKVTPWGFEGAEVTTPAPRLADSRLFGIPFEDLGLDPGTASGELAIQAVARPTFNYKTKAIQLDSSTVGTAEGSTTISIGDLDSVDVIARVDGELALAGELDVRPVAAVESVGGIPTLGLTNFSFSVVSKEFTGKAPVQFEPAKVHVPLPNLKIPTTPFSLGDAQSTAKLTKKMTVQNSGELAAVFKATSSDPRFTVTSAEVKIEPKSNYELEISFQPEGSGSAQTTITVASNDPDSPEQTITISANGPPEPEPVEEPEEEEDEPAPKAPKAPKAKASTGGCSTVATGSSATALSPLALALGLGLLARRRRRES
jgi:MYXO-CTERM domain-containing protein